MAALGVQGRNSSSFLGKELPFNLDAEKTVLSSLILNFDSVDQIADFLFVEDFYYKPHQTIYQIILEFFNENKPFDFLLLHDKLLAKNLLESVGGVPYLLELQENIATVGFLTHHAKLIKDKSLLRKLIISCSNLISECYEQKDKGISELLDSAEKQIFSISSRVASQDFVELSKLLKNTFKKISDISSQSGEITGVPSGFENFDHLTSGFQNGDLIILAARPSMGKTALALNIGLSAWKAGYPVGIFSLEMSSDQLVLRMIATESQIPHHKIRTGNICSEEWLELTNVAANLDEAKIFIDDTASISIMELRTKARRLKQKHDIKLFIVDYLQLITLDQKSENRTQEISFISRSLKGLAKELNIPIIALSQLSRSLEARMDKRPLLSDLRESGSIEQDADIVFFIYRDVVYHPETEHPNLAELIISKQRNGPVGTVQTFYDGATTRFIDISNQENDNR